MPVPIPEREPVKPLAYSITVAAQLLGICKRLMEKTIDSGDIRSVKVGRRRMISVDSLNEFLNAAT